LYCVLHSSLICGLLYTKLKEFLDLEQGKRTVFDYTRQFNTLAQQIDTDEKKVNLYHNGLTIQLQDRLVQSLNLSYNDLMSATIDQERTMKAVAEAENKKRKRTSTVAVLGQPPTIPTVAVPIATKATTTTTLVQQCSHYTAAANYSQAATATSHQQLSVIQPRKDGASGS
jgi:Na+-transporting NADH:ubiquinone oxidoreductase subunit NqrC